MSIALIEESRSAPSKSRFKSLHRSLRARKRKSKPKPSPRKLAANRANAQKSTGPKTPTGKQASSQNSLKHALCSQSPRLPNECSATYNTFVQEMRESLRPTHPLQKELFHQICSILWRLQRANETENQLYAIRQRNNDPPCLTLAKAFNNNSTSNPFLLYSRYERHLRNTYLRLIRELKKIQKEDADDMEHARRTKPAWSPQKHAAHIARLAGQSEPPMDDDETVGPDYQELWDAPDTASTEPAEPTGSTADTAWYKEMTNKWRERDKQKRLQQHREENLRIEQQAQNSTPPEPKTDPLPTPTLDDPSALQTTNHKQQTSNNEPTEPLSTPPQTPPPPSEPPFPPPTTHNNFDETNPPPLPSPSMPRLFLALLLLLTLLSSPLRAQPANTTDRSWELQYPRAIVNLVYGRFAWKSSPCLIFPSRGDNDTTRGIKEPTVVFYQNKWHLFATARSEKPSHQIVYLSFEDWNQADKSPRTILKLDPNHAASPQVFYFEPQRNWYLIYQIEDPKKNPTIQPAFSTSDDIVNPSSWTAPQPLFATQPDNVRLWTDFWVICDDTRAYLFYSSRDGNLWRSHTTLARFPHEWSRPQSCLESDMLQGARVYRLRNYRKYLTIIEAQETGRRFCKAFWADFPNGRWDDLAVSEKKSFASKLNIKQDPQWIDQISRGEILRSSYDQRMEIDPLQIRFLFAAIDEYDKTDRGYGQIPWRIGLLEAQ